MEDSKIHREEEASIALPAPGEQPDLSVPGRARSAATRGRWELLLACTVSAALAFSFLLPGVTIGYWDRDEAEYAGVAHGMAATGDFLVPRLFGAPYPDKPPLSEWLSAISYRGLGESEFAGRLPHILLAAGSVVLVLLLGHRLMGLRKGFLASVFLSSSLLYLIYGRLMVTDAALVFFTLVCVHALVRLLQGASSRRLVLLGGGALGLATLSKGPVAFLAPIFLAGGYWAAARPLPGRIQRRILAVLLLGGIVACPWFLLADRATGGRSLKAFLLRENIYRFLHPMEEHRGPIFYFAAAVIVGFFPWSGALLGLARRTVSSLGPFRIALWSWGLGVLAFFSLSATKLPHYLLPALPAFALLMADGLSWDDPRYLRFFSWATAAVGALLFLGVLKAACLWDLPGLAGGILYPFSIAAVLSLSLPLFPATGPGKQLRLPAALLVSVFIALLVPRSLDAARCLPRLGSEARGQKRSGEPVGSLNLDEPALQYYEGCDAPRRWRRTDEVIAEALGSPTRSCLVWLDSPETVFLARDRRISVRVLDQGFNLIDPTAQGYLQLLRVSAREDGPARLHQMNIASP